MMHHSPALKMLGMASWIITGLASINMLTAMYDYDFFAWVMRTTPGMIVPLFWLVGLAGIVSIAMFVKASFMCCPVCNACPCNCTTNKF